MPKVIAIVGATGAQGGGLARTILAREDDEFSVRALTRRPDSDAARGLADAGAQVVQADLDEPESVRRGFQGAYGAFCLTNFWEHFSPEKEKEQAHTMAQAAEAEGVEHVIWSTLEDMRVWVPLSDDRMPTLMEHYKVPHFDAKGEADRYFMEGGAPATCLRTSFYWDNFIHFGMGPRDDGEGGLVLTLPIGDARLPGMASEDIGKCALGILQAGDRFQGQTVTVTGEKLTGEEMAKSFTQALGREVRYNPVSPETYRSFGFDGADDLGNMFQVMRDFNEEFCRPRDPTLSRQLNPELKSFQEWLGRNKDRIPLG